MEIETAESTKEPDEFYFESDHLALRGNKDYLSLLNAVIVLEAQRTRAVQDLDILLENRDKALKDPISFISKLQNNDLPELPGPNKIQNIPHIDWCKYNVGIDRIKPQTRNGNFIPQPNMKLNKHEDGQVYVRGRVYNESKPETFNQLWTAEEQQRLDELLKEFPPEEVEMRRWTKIADALGSRTPKQVSSRVQKYFHKLSKAGIAFAGRKPKSKLETKKNHRHRHHRNASWLSMKKSTFFPQHDFPEAETSENNHQDQKDDSRGNIIDSNSELEQIELLRKIKAEKEQGNKEFVHFGYKCFICGEEPLKGSRWKCTECPNVNLCSDCAISALESVNPKHPPSHKFKVISSPESSSSTSNNYDSDYFPHKFELSSYNHLDPSFLPE